MLPLLVAIAAAACPVTSADIDADVDAVERAFAALDEAGVKTAGRRLEAETACLIAPIDPARAVRVHAAVGLAAFVAGDSERAAAAFAAARRIDPTWAPDPELIPKGHPIRTLAARNVASTLPSSPIPRPARGTILLDGTATSTRPAEVATVAQWVVDGDVVTGAYAWPDAALPAYDLPAPIAKKHASPAAWIAVASGGAVASAASFYLAARARDAWEAAETGPEITAHYTENHVLYGVGAGFGVVAAAGGVGAVVALAF